MNHFRIFIWTYGSISKFFFQLSIIFSCFKIACKGEMRLGWHILKIWQLVKLMRSVRVNRNNINVFVCVIKGQNAN